MKALVLAGGYPQIALINELKSRGITVLLADYYEKAIAREYADEFYCVSTLDVDAIKELAKNEKVDFLITACTDQALLTVAKVSEELGLPCYIDYQTGLNVTNKEYMKQKFVEFDIPSAKHYVMGELDMDLIKNIKYPLIVKPVDCNSSKGVKKVYSEEDLQESFATAVKLSRTSTAIVEEFNEGIELTCDVYVENGVAHLLSVSCSDKIADDTKFVIFRTRYPGEASDEIIAQIKETAQKIADAFHLKNSPMLIQMISNGKNISVIEFSARTGGGVKYQLIKKVSGFDVISAVVDLTLGIKPTVKIRKPETKYLTNTFIYCKPGVFDRLNNFEELKKENVITEYFQFKWSGAAFDSVENSGDRVAGFTVQADTFAQLQEKYVNAINKMQVLDENGNDMMRRDLLPEIIKY